MGEIITMIVQYGSMALTALFAFGVVVGLIFGLIRGWKRSLIRFILILVCVILAAVLAPIGYNSALNTDVSTVIPGSSGTLEDYIMEEVEGAAGDMGAIATEVPEIVQALLKIVGIFVNLVAFVGLFILFRFISWILFGLVKLIFLGRDRAKKKEAKLAKKSGFSTPKYKKGALFGGLIGIVQGTAIALAFFIPLCAVMGTVGAFTQAIGEQNIDAIIADDQNELSEIMEFVVALDEAYKNSVPGMVYTGTGIDKWIYGPLTTVNVGEEEFDLQSIALLAGGVYKVINEFGKLELPEPYTQAQFEAYLDQMLDIAEEAIPLLLQNGLIRIFINELGQAIADGIIDLNDLTSSNTGNYQNVLTSMALIKIVEAENEEPQDDPMGDFIMDAILGLIGDLASNGNLADALEETLLSIVGTVKDLNEQQIIYPIVKLTEAEEGFDLFDDMDMAQGIGKALDEILAVPALASFTDIVFVMIEEAMGEALDGMGLPVDMSQLNLAKVSWQSAIETIALVLDLMETMDGGDITAIKGDDVVAMIDSLRPNEQSGLIAVFEGFLKGMIAELLDDEDIDLTDVDLEILSNSKQFGVLFDMLAEADSFDVLAKSPSAFSNDDLAVLESLSAYLNELNKGTAGFKALVGALVNTMLDGMIGIGGDVDDVIDLVAKSVKAYKLFVELKNKTPIPTGNLGNWQDMDPAELAESFTPDMAEELIETIADPVILDTVEQMLQDAGGAVELGEHEQMVQDTFDSLLDQMAENPPEDIEEKLEQYERLADMLGLDTSKLGGLLGGGN